MSETITLAVRSLQIAETFLGVKEDPIGSNRGPEVNKFLASVGLGPGYPWCMAFVYYCVSKAAAELGLPNPLVMTGGVMDQYERSPARKLSNRDSGVKPGDVGIMRFANGNGHTFFVRTKPSGLVNTIEGNTNDDGSREGYEVAHRSRAIGSIYAFIQIP